MADIALTDPLGRTLLLHGHTWFGHILKHHAELRAYRKLVEATVTDPREIRISPSDPKV